MVAVSKPITIIPEEGLGSALDRLVWIRRERDILAEDTEMAGGRLVAITMFLQSINEPTIRAIMITAVIDAHADLGAVCKTMTAMLGPLSEAAEKFRLAIGIVEAATELTFGGEVLAAITDKEEIIGARVYDALKSNLRRRG